MATHSWSTDSYSINLNAYLSRCVFTCEQDQDTNKNKLYICVCIEIREMCVMSAGDPRQCSLYCPVRLVIHAQTHKWVRICVWRDAKILITQCSHDTTDFNPNAHTHTVTDMRVLMYKIHIDAFILPTVCVLMKKKTRRLDEERY